MHMKVKKFNRNLFKSIIISFPKSIENHEYLPSDIQDLW